MSQIKNIDVVALKHWLDNQEAILIDVREADEVKAAHIPGSIHIPLNACSIDSIPHDENKKLVFQCAKGGRSAKACQWCMGMQPDKEIWNLEGGIEAWIAAGFPVNKG